MMFMNPMMSQQMTPEMQEQMKRQMYMSMGARMMMAGGQGKSTGEALGSSVLGGMGDAESMMKAGLQTQMQGMQLNKLKQEAATNKEYMDMLAGMDTPEGKLGPLAMGSARKGNPTMLANMMNPSKIMQGNVNVGKQAYPYLFSQDAMGGQSGAKFMPQPNAYSMMSGMFGDEGGATPPSTTEKPTPPPTLSSSIKAVDNKEAAAVAAAETKRVVSGKMDRLTQNLQKAGMQWAGGEWIQVQPGFPNISETEAKVLYKEFSADFNFYGPGDQAAVTELMRQLKQKYGF